MSNLFSQILNMSLTASIIILFVMAARLLLKKAPKIYSYALWAVVLFRLLCPVSLASSVSVLEVTKPQVRESTGITSTVTYVPYAVPETDNRIQEEPVSISDLMEPQKETAPDFMEIASGIWLAGIAVMVLYSVVTYLRLYRSLVGAMLWRGNVYLADHIQSPFVLGTLFPKIYLPSNTPVHERRYIVAHERHHIRRGDHIIKLLAYGALCIHWFNPLVWAAFLLAGKDMEMSCDEAVIKKLGEHIRADYSASLLRLATHRTIIAGTPLAFGEGDTKGRVMNMAKWKKPKAWVSVLCVILCAVIFVACAVNPEKEETVDIANVDDNSTEATEQMEESIGNEVPTVLQLGEDAVQIESSEIRYGSLSLTLPEGYAAELEDGNIILQKDGQTVGGIQLWRTPEFALISPSESLEGSNMKQWVQALGIPEAQESDEPVAHMIEGSPECGYLSAWYGNELEPEKLNKEHNLFIAENYVYDIWFDENQISDIHSGKFLKTVYISGEPTVITQTDEGSESLEKCRAVLDLVQSGSCQIAIEQVNGNTNTRWSVSNFYQHDGNWLKIIDIDPETEDIADGEEWSARLAYMYANGVRYSNEGRGGNAYSDINWAEYEYFDDSLKPWLPSFQWNDQIVTYVDTLISNGDTVVMLRIDEPYPGLEEETVCYWVDFCFDASGSFIKAELEVDYIHNDEVQSIDNTESIVTLDPDTVAAEIDREYRRAIS